MIRKVRYFGGEEWLQTFCTCALQGRTWNNGNKHTQNNEPKYNALQIKEFEINMSQK